MLIAVLLGLAQGASAETTETTTAYWKLAVKPDAAAATAGRDPFTEYVMIDDDVTAQEMSRLGFGPINPILGTDATGATTFTVTLTSTNHGTVKWTGKMTATTMSGTLVWTREGKVYNYTFTGVPHTPETNVES